MQNWDEQADLLRRKAGEDEQAIAVLSQMNPSLVGIIAFHAQQSVEKRLKALLCDLRLNYPRTHDLDQLLTVIMDAGVLVPEEVWEAAVLTGYAVQFRYAELGEKGSPDVKGLRDLTETVRAWTERSSPRAK